MRIHPSSGLNSVSPGRAIGASVYLVLACALVIILLGIGFVVMIMIMGGERELTHATDAGVLNIAKQSMYQPSVPSVGTSFEYCVDPPGNPITLYSYNRCVAKAMLVALNAQRLGTPQARANAHRMYDELQAVASQLRVKLNDANLMGPYFDSVAGANNLRMLGSNATNRDAFQAGYMYPGQSTNIYFTSGEFPVTEPPGIRSEDDDTVPPQVSTGRYMAGYRPIVIDGMVFMGVPVFPEKQPHLVSLKDFERYSSPNVNVPPNSFRVAASSHENNSQTSARSSSAALAGSLLAGGGLGSTSGGTGGGGSGGTGGGSGGTAGGSGGGSSGGTGGGSSGGTGGGGGNPPGGDPPGSFPGAVNGGYLEIVNKPGSGVSATPVDNAHNIFNNELYFEPGISVGGDTGDRHTGAFSTDAAQMDAWGRYNASTGGDPNGHDGSLYPPNNGFNVGNIYVVNDAWAAGRAAALPGDLQLLLKINAPDNCLQQLEQGMLTGKCHDMLWSMEETYHPGPHVGPPDSRTIFSAVDVAKCEVIKAFGEEKPKFDFDGDAVPPTGLGKYANGHQAHYPTPYLSLPMQKTGTVAELLHQIGPCAETGIKDQIRQRCKEIKPSATNAEIDQLLETPIPMGTTLYIYATGTAPGTLVCNASRPPSYSGVQPDGVPDNNCKKEYDVIDTLVDTDQAGRGFGDLNLHGQPYMRKRGGPLIGKDLVEWTSSSGYGNLLGRLELSNAVSGQVRFKKPN